jgi:hypothetical protein
MKKQFEIITIIYGKFLDHSSTSNIWLTQKEFDDECLIEECDFCGFLEKEDNLAYYVSTMRTTAEKGSGHTVLKSTLIYTKKIQFKVPKIDVGTLNKEILIDTPLFLQNTSKNLLKP